MAQSLSKVWLHIVFGTQDRMPLIRPLIEEKLHRYLKSVCANNGIWCEAINGIPDHVHMLTDLPRSLSISDLVKLLKTSSSRWLKDQGADFNLFAWQSGYGAFSVSASNVPAVITYIERQKEHHTGKLTFENEFVALLEKHHVKYQEKYLWA